jgi:hypothetical protein
LKYGKVYFSCAFAIKYMKILLLLALLLFSLTASAQHLQPEPKDDIVIIATRDSLPDALKKLQLLLADNGYIITQVDKELYSLQTDYLPINRTLAKMQLTATIREQGGGINYINLQGKYVLSAVISGGELSGIAQFAGLGTGANKLCYREVEKLAKLYPNAEVYYGKR